MKYLIILGALLIPMIANADVFDDTISYYDNLKVCKAHTFSYPHPFVKDFTGVNKIKGKNADKCEVEMLMPNNMKLDCKFSAKCVNALTSAKAYEDARNKVMHGNSNSEESQCMNNECKILQ